MKKVLPELLFAFAIAFAFLAILWILNMPINSVAFVVALVAFVLALLFRFSPDRSVLAANSFGTLNTTLIAQKTLTTLLAKFPLLAKISTDFGDAPLLFNQSIKVKLATARTAIAYSTTNGYVPADGTLADTTVTLNQHIHDTYQVNDQEASSTNINLIDKFANLSAYALGRAIFDALWNLILNANYSNSTTIGVGAFDRDGLIDVNKALDDRNVPDFERMAILNNAYFAALKKDLVVVSQNTNPSGEKPIQTGVLPDVDGCMVTKSTAADDNSENLAGAVMIPEAMALATRVPMAPPEGLPIGGIVSVVKDAASGLAIQVREWYDFALGQHRRTSTLMYGVAVGNPLVLQRILSA